MGMFTKAQKASATAEYENVKKYLSEKDGNVHVVMLNSFSKLVNQIFGCEDKYTTQINEIISAMQADGYEIVDIKLTALQNQGMTGNSEGFNTLIMYK